MSGESHQQQDFHSRFCHRTGRRSRNAGFTLIEIMVVAFILGLLGTMLAPKIIRRTDEARRTKAAAELRGVEQTRHLYKLDNGPYPTTDQGLSALVNPPDSGIVPVKWNPDGYLEKMPTDP